ncbi:hypothetical protein CANCADRAFT_137040 [Tortispora caseinolytica NRRL Y-17796]|uniref:Uncharacterized protein n=1 Tax=Tortispora caseinolytica NRRL Y-17796 TaxID=767744 RepID=A0A1E4TBZ3_9ASCO|nr:hypothetical protein CANCADRAFT_137040 [Tortispora caseinolytica NRRL Y-17796]
MSLAASMSVRAYRWIRFLIACPIDVLIIIFVYLPPTLVFAIAEESNCEKFARISSSKHTWRIITRKSGGYWEQGKLVYNIIHVRSHKCTCRNNSSGFQPCSCFMCHHSRLHYYIYYTAINDRLNIEESIFKYLQLMVCNAHSIDLPTTQMEFFGWFRSETGAISSLPYADDLFELMEKYPATTKRFLDQFILSSSDELHNIRVITIEPINYLKYAAIAYYLRWRILPKVAFGRLFPSLFSLNSLPPDTKTAETSVFLDKRLTWIGWLASIDIWYVSPFKYVWNEGFNLSKRWTWLLDKSYKTGKQLQPHEVYKEIYCRFVQCIKLIRPAISDAKANNAYGSKLIMKIWPVITYLLMLQHLCHKIGLWAMPILKHNEGEDVIYLGVYAPDKHRTYLTESKYTNILRNREAPLMYIRLYGRCPSIRDIKETWKTPLPPVCKFDSYANLCHSVMRIAFGETLSPVPPRKLPLRSKSTSAIPIFKYATKYPPYHSCACAACIGGLSSLLSKSTAREYSPLDICSKLTSEISKIMFLRNLFLYPEGTDAYPSLILVSYQVNGRTRHLRLGSSISVSSPTRVRGYASGLLVDPDTVKPLAVLVAENSTGNSAFWPLEHIEFPVSNIEQITSGMDEDDVQRSLVYSDPLSFVNSMHQYEDVIVQVTKFGSPGARNREIREKFRSHLSIS